MAQSQARKERRLKAGIQNPFPHSQKMASYAISDGRVYRSRKQVLNTLKRA